MPNFINCEKLLAICWKTDLPKGVFKMMNYQDMQLLSELIDKSYKDAGLEIQVDRNIVFNSNRIRRMIQ